ARSPGRASRARSPSRPRGTSSAYRARSESVAHATGTASGTRRLEVATPRRAGGDELLRLLPLVRGQPPRHLARLALGRTLELLAARDTCRDLRERLGAETVGSTLD